MDEIDYASERAAVFTETALMSVLRRPTRHLSTGICPSCQERIEEERLRANPYAALCGDCASEEEDFAKRLRRCGPR